MVPTGSTSPAHSFVREPEAAPERRGHRLPCLSVQTILRGTTGDATVSGRSIYWP